jgi:hypothetical protein
MDDVPCVQQSVRPFVQSSSFFSPCLACKKRSLGVEDDGGGKEEEMAQRKRPIDVHT